MVRIFGTKSGKFQELLEEKEGGKYFDYEKSLQGLIENNLSNIFTDLEFVKSEHQIENFRLDTIALDIGRNSFVIIEYKNKKNESLIEQGISYYQLLQEKKENFVLLYNKIKKKNFDVKDVNWDDTRIIFISPKFSKYQKKASGFRGVPTEMWEVKKYEKGFLTLDKVDVSNGYSSNTGKPKSTTKSTTKLTTKYTTKYTTKQRPELTEYNEDDYLDGKYDSTATSEKTRKLWNSIKAILLEKFENLECVQKKKYAGFYSKTDNTCICTIYATKNIVNLSYATTKKNLLPQTGFVTHTLKGHYGAGHYVSKLTTINDIKNALQYIEIVYQLKVK